MHIDRRNLIIGASALGSGALFAKPVFAPGARAQSSPAQAEPAPRSAPAALAGLDAGVSAAVFRALERHGADVVKDRVAVADYSQPSWRPRFHIINLQDGRSESYLVSHGSGSDPGHSGWLQRYSDRPGSNASSEGAYKTADYYVGKHGKSQRLHGLDSTNGNAMDRLIVLHGSWYAEPSMVEQHGKLGRSQGCFAFGDSLVAQVYEQLGPGRMVFATGQRQNA